MRLILCDTNPDMVRAWEREFADGPDIEVRAGDLTQIAADAYVSPANSHGYMDGGIDLVYSHYFGYQIENFVQRAIREQGRMLPVGQALIVETEDDRVPYLIVAPTMEYPSYVADTDNANRAMWAMLHVLGEFEEASPGEIETVVCPGFCTGVGGMPPETAARQMRSAYEDFLAMQNETTVKERKESD